MIGLGKSGFAAAKFLHGLGAKVRATDSSEKKEVLENADFLKSLGLTVETGRHTAPFMKGADLMVTSPGVSPKSKPLQFAKKAKIPVISEIELASYHCRGLQVAVTGSNGKTTTSHLIYRIFQEFKPKSVLCGNVGFSFLDAIPSTDNQTLVVIELSSFQLEESPAFRPKIAVVLNISPNHLDRHGSMKNYIEAKERIFKNQTRIDTLVLNYDDSVVRNMAAKARSTVVYFSKHEIPEGIFARGAKIIVKKGDCEKVFLDRSRFKLKGDHNLENILAAVSVASILKVPSKKAQKVLDSFETLEHRIEPAGTVNGVHFINDSKSTTIESAKAAILATPRPLILIAGGRDKGAPFERIESLLDKQVKYVVLYGEAREKIASSWRNFDRMGLEKDFRNAVKRAFNRAERGDSILLSPMCTSFDQFSCFEERGEVFKQVIEELRLVHRNSAGSDPQ